MRVLNQESKEKLAGLLQLGIILLFVYHAIRREAAGTVKGSGKRKR